VSEGASVFVGDTRVAARVPESVSVCENGQGDRLPLSLTGAAHASRHTLVATAHATAHGHA
jgi:hypothetical protein